MGRPGWREPLCKGPPCAPMKPGQRERKFVRGPPFCLELGDEDRNLAGGGGGEKGDVLTAWEGKGRSTRNLSR